MEIRPSSALAVHAGIHGHDIGGHFIVTDQCIGAIQLGLQRDNARQRVIQAVDQTLQTLYVQTGKGDGRCGHDQGRLLSSARKKQNPARKRRGFHKASMG
jgi:hypothetical protein